MNRLLRIGVSAALLTWIATKTDWQGVQHSFTHLRVEFWLAALGMLMVSQIISAWRWQLLAQPLGFDRPFKQMTGFYLIGSYFNLLLPTSVGGDVIRAWYLAGPAGRRLAAFVTVFLDRLSGLLVLVAIACAAVTLCPLDLPPWITWSVWGIAASGVAGLIALPWVAGWGKNGPVRKQQLRTTLGLLRQPGVAWGTTALSLCVQVLSITQVWLVGQAIHAQIPGSFYWILVPMVSLLTLLPVSVNGMGVREGGTALLLAPLGVDHGTALSLAFLWFAVYVVLSLMGGLVYMFGHFPKPQASPLTSPDGDSEHGPVDCDSDQGRAGQSRQAA